MYNVRRGIVNYFSNNNLNASSSDDDFKTYPTKIVGFEDNLTSYNAWAANPGFSVAAVDNASVNIVHIWNTCRRSYDSLSGGHGSCTASFADWKARSADHAANFIFQVRNNDYFKGVTTGPRVYFETLMGEYVNLTNYSSRDSTEWQWVDQYNNT